ncbi:beta-propeller domain-containing protein [Vallitalea sediminicola]
MKKFLSLNLIICILSLIITGSYLLIDNNNVYAEDNQSMTLYGKEEINTKEIFNPSIDIIHKIQSQFDFNLIKKIIKPTVNKDTFTLPTIKSKEELMRLIKDNMYDYCDIYNGKNNIEVTYDNGTYTDSKSSEKLKSNTNNQVQGVEEGDSVKTDGKYIYIANNNKISIISTDPKEAKVISEITLGEDEKDIEDIFLVENKLIVVGNKYGFYVDKKPMYDKNKKGTIGFRHTHDINVETSFVKIYDLKNIDTSKLIKDYTFDGYYISARTIGNNFYMVTSKTISEYRYYNYKEKDDFEDNILPFFMDNKTKEKITINYNQIKYFPGNIEPNYLVTIGIDLKDIEEIPDVNAYLGNTQNIYVSQNYLYTALYKEHETIVYQFRLENGKIAESGKGKVNGNILNQFSMDEYNNYFRIATTSWNTNKSKNNVYILDDDMNTVGKLENIAEGEKIYSTRFMGDNVYMVTFKQIDPFFVIDTSDVTQPQILGYLKIPGYSKYLHMIDDTHVLGFGQETHEGKYGTRTDGFKISLFDVTDFNNPIEKDKTLIGETGTSSELLFNHKALMYLNENNMMAFPIQIVEDNKHTFKGAYIYNINDYHLELKGGLTQFDDSSEFAVYYPDKNITRILSVDKYLYTISPNAVFIHNINDLSKAGEVKLQ